MTTGWLKSLDGDDVYTEDGEWFWHHRTQGWYYEPGLLVMPPAPPLMVQVQDIVDDLSTGWPSLRSAIIPVRMSEMVIGVPEAIAAWIFRGFLAYTYVWWIPFNIVPIARVYLDFFGIVNWQATTVAAMNEQGYYFTKTAVLVYLSFPVTYLLYMLRAGSVDSRKGIVMAGAAMAYTGYQAHQRHDAERDHRLAREIAAELDRKHRGGYSGLCG